MDNANLHHTNRNEIMMEDENITDSNVMGMSQNDRNMQPTTNSHREVNNTYTNMANETTSSGSGLLHNVSGGSGSFMTSSMTRGRSKVWNEFTRAPDGRKVICRQCGDSLSYSHSHSTSSMLKHLKRKHDMDLYPPNEESMKPTNQDKSQDRFGKKLQKGKKILSDAPEEEEEPPIEPSIQHDPLMFTDPCVRMRWADHSDTFLKTFSHMYNDETYTDCTLVADKQFFKAHRVILSSASEFLDDMFKMTPVGQHPLIFLKDVKAMELRLLLDFIYKGEVSIPPSLIPGLVKVGGELKVKGLSDFVWNDQLASNIFQGYQTMEARVNQTIHQPQVSTVQHVQQNNSTTPITSNTVINKVVSPLRIITQHQTSINPSNPIPLSTSAYNLDKQIHPTTVFSGSNRNFTRIMTNTRPLTVPSQNIAVSLGDGSALLNQGNGGFKRIRILTTSLPVAKAQLQNSQPFDPHSSLEGGDSGRETVLMVTNQGETMLSTSQGGVTVMAPNSLTIPMGINVKDERCMDSHSGHQLDSSDHLGSHPITILSSSSNPTTVQDLEEVVYSITEVPGGGHEVMYGYLIDKVSAPPRWWSGYFVYILMPENGEEMEQESIVVYGEHQSMSACETVDRKPFQLDISGSSTDQ